MSVKDKVEGKEKEEESVETSQDTESEDKETSIEDKEETLSEEDKEEQAAAVKLYRDLRGPKGLQTLEGIAKSAGLTLGGTKKEIKEQVKTVAEILESELGEDYGFLSKKLGTAFEKIIAEKLLPHVESAKESSIEAKVDGHLKDIFEEQEIPKKERENLRSKMDKLSLDMPYSGKGNLKVYLKRLCSLVISEDGKTRQRIERINRNAEDAEDTSAGEAITRIVAGPKDPTLRQAIEAAARGERWE